MKKLVALLALSLALLLVFAGCRKNDPAPGEPSFSLNSEEKIITVTGNDALQGSGGVGYLSFEEGQTLLYQFGGEEAAGRLRVVVFYKEEPENPLSYSEPDNSDKVYMDFTVDSSTSGQIEMDAGEYALLIEVDSASFTGTATFKSE